MNIKGIASAILKAEAAELIKAADRLDDSVNAAADIIYNHPGKLVICGLGKSGLIAQKIVATLCSTGTQAVFLHAAEALHGDLGIYKAGDPTILISKSGSTEEILRLIPILRDFQSPLIGIVGKMDSPVAKKMDIVLDASVTKEADPLGVVPTSSTTLTMAIGDALAGVLMTMGNFNHEDFARYHPGGALGRRLSLRVSDIMQPLDQVASVAPEHKLRKIVICMTEKPQGAALVMDGKNILLGIITDGDLRRCLAEKNDIDKLTATEIMTSNPICIPIHARLNDAMILMEDRESQISVLPIVGADGQTCQGLLRIHDIHQTRLL